MAAHPDPRARDEFRKRSHTPQPVSGQDARPPSRASSEAHADLPEPCRSGRLGGPQGAKYNLGANSVQANPNKTKQKSLDFLGFIRPNRGFSMGYGRKNKKNRLASQVVSETSQIALFISFPLGKRLAKAPATF
jgi:hypothetical protein